MLRFYLAKPFDVLVAGQIPPELGHCEGLVQLNLSIAAVMLEREAPIEISLNGQQFVGVEEALTYGYEQQGG